MKWAQQQRIEAIQRRLAITGHINRQDLMSHFGISIAQASIDFRIFRDLYPKAMRYNLSTKRYEARTTSTEGEK